MGFSIGETAEKFLLIGAVVTVAPAAVTFMIAASRAILTDLIASAILLALTGGNYYITGFGGALIEVPFLWKVSILSAKIGVCILAITLLASLISNIIDNCLPHKTQASIRNMQSSCMRFCRISS